MKRCACLRRLSVSPGRAPTSHLLGQPFLILQCDSGELSVSAFAGKVGIDEGVTAGGALEGAVLFCC